MPGPPRLARQGGCRRTGATSFVLGLALCLAAEGCSPDGLGGTSVPATSSAAPWPGPTGAPVTATTGPAGPADLDASARELAKRYIIVDGHVDLPYRLKSSRDEAGNVTEDISIRTAEGDFDYPRAVAGGLDAPFMSIFVPAKHQLEGGGRELADGLIDMVEGLSTRWPDKLAPAHSVADVKRNFAAGRISLALGIENGAAFDGDLANVKHFYDRGVRYVTLAHSKDNKICDSSYDDTHTWGGLSPFGKEVVAELNRVGIMIDISHVTDDAARQVLELTKTPVIASHSGARHFTPGFARNMADAEIERLAAGGGVLMINFGSTFISAASREYFDVKAKARTAYMEKEKLERDDPRTKAFDAGYKKGKPVVLAEVGDVADHIDHVVALVGIDHVGLGSDFDGVGDSLPAGLKDASEYPNLLSVLLGRGYSEADIEKICSGNIFRVWSAVEAFARSAP